MGQGSLQRSNNKSLLGLSPVKQPNGVQGPTQFHLHPPVPLRHRSQLTAEHPSCAMERQPSGNLVGNGSPQPSASLRCSTLKSLSQLCSCESLA
jgi:hypothetical protein